ncbi:IclR family transcriptional regulator domain-containing protein [Lentzea indica]|uniref:IclR family transcriptional regulator domain-containing protein n=1 Tax=Lentzea indica TaxID=2604800 RepID=UPI0028AD01C4|nr:IclR family transcriptional regulator C-terminal domain-containing protein [Lentzea indica]
MSHGERESGASGAAVPVVDAQGRIVAALALGGPTTRFTEDRVPSFREALARAAQEISQLGLPSVV